MQQPGLIATKVDRYEVERLLGMGGFGSVYRAKHVHTGATVALKLLKRSLGADQGMLERFLREARAAASVGSEHIVGVLDAGLATDGQAFLALEFLDGSDLKDLATNEGPLPHLRVVMIVLQVLEGLAAAHAKDIVHRDMKPANVFVVRRRDERGVERDFIKLLDFGISKMHGDAGTSGLTMTGVAMGTPSYMAPEQFFDARSVDGRADLYSVSAMLYELLSGKLPFDAESYAHLIVKVRTEQAAPLNQVAPQVPMALAQVVTVGLAKEPHQRWQSAKEFGDALRSALGLPAPGTTPAFLPSQSQAPRSLGSPASDIGFDRTHTPMPSAPVQPVQLVQPAPPVKPSVPPSAAGWQVPTSGSANTGVPIAVAPVPPAAVSQPASTGGWVGNTPILAVSMPGQIGARSPTTAPPTAAVAAPGAAPAQKSSALKWALIVLGMIFLAGGCCTCAVVSEMAKPSADPAAVEGE